ncbi:MAG: transglutaminase domain-containing protein [Mobilitalea sp.]
MFKDREKLYQVYHTMLSMALTWALALAINQYFGLRAHIILCAIYSFFPALMIYLFDQNKKNAVTYILLGSIFPILALIFWLRKVNPLDWINELIGWCAQYNGSEELYVAHHANFIVFMVGLLGATLFFLLTKKQLAKNLLAVVLMATMIILSVSEVDINKAVVGICIFYILTIIVELCGSIYSKKSGIADKKEGILYLAPVCLLLAVLSVILPSKPEPIQWNGIKDIYVNVKEQFEVWRSDIDYYFSKKESEFFVNLTGYSEDNSELSKGNELTKDNKIALKVTSTRVSNPIYLIGSISDVYTGSRWEKSRSDYMPEEQEYLLDYTELVYALSRQDVEVLESNRFFERNVLKINYNTIKTKTFFYPIKSSSYKMLSKEEALSTAPSNITFPEVRGKGTNYETVFYEMNLQGDAFQKMLREADSFSYDNPTAAKLVSLQYVKENMSNQDTNVLLKRWNFYEILGERAELIKRQYTSLPEDLPDRVKDLANEITTKFDTKFDKLKAIESFLREYTYSLDPEQVPRGEDFTDYFLFESQEGYCTSYATAMAVLGRCLGIPTRYVEGFVVKFVDKDKKNMFAVRNNQAHAWAEAYIEGIGWIPFEATSPFFNVRYTKWRELPKGEEASYVPHDNPYNQEDLLQDLGINLGHDFELAEEEEESNSDNILNGFIIFLSAILILLLFLIIYYLSLKYSYKKIFHKADNSKKMYMLFLRILSLLKQEGFVLDQQETILMLSGRVKDRFHYDRIIFPDIANIFMRYRYAEEEVTLEEFKKVEIYCEGLSITRREKQGRIKIWLEEFVFLAKKSNR